MMANLRILLPLAPALSVVFVSHVSGMEMEYLAPHRWEAPSTLSAEHSRARSLGETGHSGNAWAIPGRDHGIGKFPAVAAMLYPPENYLAETDHGSRVRPEWETIPTGSYAFIPYEQSQKAQPRVYQRSDGPFFSVRAPYAIVPSYTGPHFAPRFASGGGEQEPRFRVPARGRTAFGMEPRFRVPARGGSDLASAGSRPGGLEERMPWGNPPLWNGFSPPCPVSLPRNVSVWSRPEEGHHVSLAFAPAVGRPLPPPPPLALPREFVQPPPGPYVARPMPLS